MQPEILLAAQIISSLSLGAALVLWVRHSES
jgi:hypothetical protein